MKDKNFKIGDTVEMFDCGEAEHYKDKIWVCRSDSFFPKNYPTEEVVFLEGFAGWFSCKYLRTVVKPVTGSVVKYPSDTVMPHETTKDLLSHSVGAAVGEEKERDLSQDDLQDICDTVNSTTDMWDDIYEKMMSLELHPTEHRLKIASVREFMTWLEKYNPKP